MRTLQLSIQMLMTGVCACAAFGQSQNTFEATGGTLDFNDQNNWNTNEGPASWAHGTIVNGSLIFDTHGATTTVDQIDSNFSWITGLETTNGGDLTLTGDGSLSFYNGGGTIVITPSGDLDLDVNTFFAGAVHLNLENAGSTDQITIHRLMALSGSNSHMLISGNGEVVFTQGSRLNMNGTIQVGYTVGTVNTPGSLLIQDSETLDDAAVRLVIGLDSTVTFGLSTTENETFEIWGLTGSGLLKTQSATDQHSANVFLQGGTFSEFNGYFQLDGQFTVSGENTTLYFNPDLNPVATISTLAGGIRVEDGGAFLLGSENQLAWLFNVSITIDGGMFGGNGKVNLFNYFSSNPADLLRFEGVGGWLVGGDPNTGAGSLEITGLSFFLTIGAGNGLWANVNPETVVGHGPYIHFGIPAAGTPFFTDGANMHVQVLGEGYIASTTQIIIMQYTGGLVPNNLLQYAGFSFPPDFNYTTNLVTRTVVPEDTWTPGTSFGASASQIAVRLEANYAAPAGGLAGLGAALNELIPQADADITSPAAQLLSQLETYAHSEALYQQALSWMLPTSEFVADRITANNMFFETQRRNIRELAIGSRAPGMLKAQEERNAMLFASLQEEDAVATVADQQTTRVIIQPGPTSSSDDVFQALYIDAYGRWDNMNAVAYVPGYSADIVGVEAGWGIGLSHGITLGISAGWENVNATLHNDLGNIDVNSFRAAPFLAWSGLSGDTEQYAMLTVGGGYNYGHGQRTNVFGTNSTVDIHGWEFDIEGAVGTRVPLTEVLALQPEASLRYSVVHFNGTETDLGISSDYSGDDFQFVNGRIGTALEWLVNSSTRLSGSIGYQGQYLDWRDATFDLPGGLGTATQDGGSGTVNQVYTGLQLEWTPSWNTAITINYDGAFGQGTQNAISGGVLMRF